MCWFATDVSFGKTVFSINEIKDRALRCPLQNPQYAFIAPTYGQAERIAWDMLKTYTKMIPGVVYNEQKLTCRIPRPDKGDAIKIMLLGAENPDSIRGIYLDGCVLDEYAEMDPRIWGQVIRPALSDRGGWAIFIGTPKGQNHFYEVYNVAVNNAGNHWYSAIYRASESDVLPPEEIEQMKLDMTDDEIAQELECSFNAAITGAYWGKQMTKLEENNRITSVPHDPALQVDTFWDLGVDDSTSIWFLQQVGNEVRVIDYEELVGDGIPEFAKALKSGDRADYNYRNHNWPHDGDSRDLSTGQERSVTARKLGIKPLIVHPRYDVADSIDAGRRLLARCIFDKEKCTKFISGEKLGRGIPSLKMYQKDWDAKNKVYLSKPKHDWASHAGDAWRLAGMAIKPGADRQINRSNLPRHSIHDYNTFRR